MTEPLSRKINGSFYIPLGVAASCFMGIFTHSSMQNGVFMAAIFKAFTIQSNIWAGSIALIGLGFSLFSNRRNLPTWLEPIRFMFTTSITLTWLAFAILLTPTMSLSYLLSQSNFYLHSLTPILSVIDYIRQPDQGVPIRNLWTVMIMPILYGLYFFLEYAYTGDMPVRYFFMDYRKHGWFRADHNGIGVVYWMIILVTTLVGIGRGLLALRELGKRHPLKTSLWTAGIMLLISALMILVRWKMPSTEKDSSS
jgi:hypothetical protein